MYERVMCADAMDTIGAAPLVDALITDPPFGLGKTYNGTKEHTDSASEYWKWFEPYYTAALAKVKPGGFVAIWQTQLYYKHFWEWFGNDIHIYVAAKNWVQLRKTPINFGYDPVVMFYKAGALPMVPTEPARNIDYYVANIAGLTRNPDPLAKQHPYPRPYDQVWEIVANFAPRGGTILDPFCGSGTLGKACRSLYRGFHLGDIEQTFVDLTNARVAEIPA